MRILFISNFYPPYVRGGHEVECHEVRQLFEARGHKTIVLTSKPGGRKSSDEQAGIYRWLALDMALRPNFNSFWLLTGTQRRRRENQKALQSLAAQFQPDIIFIWGMWNLHASLAVTAEQIMGDRVLYRMADYWPTLPDQKAVYWSRLAESGPKRWLKKGLRGIAGWEMGRNEQDENTPSPAFAHVICVSEALKRLLIEQNIPIEHAQVIYPGIKVSDFYRARDWSRLASSGETLQMLHAGRLSPEKGTDTVIRAYGRLVQQLGDSAPRLILVGAASTADQQMFNQLALENGLEGKISWLGRVPREEMGRIMAESHLFLFASTWEEPFSRVVLEAMAAGLLVLGATSGGTGEVLIDGVTGVAFSPGDTDELAQQAAAVQNDRELLSRIASRGQLKVAEEFDFEPQVMKIEKFIQSIINASVS